MVPTTQGLQSPERHGGMWMVDFLRGGLLRFLSHGSSRNVFLSVTLVQTKISSTNGWFATKFYTDIHESERMNHDFSDFSSSDNSRLIFVDLSEMLHKLVSMVFVRHFHFLYKLFWCVVGPLWLQVTPITNCIQTVENRGEQAFQISERVHEHIINVDCATLTHGLKLNKYKPCEKCHFCMVTIDLYIAPYQSCCVCASVVVIGCKKGTELTGCRTYLETSVPLIIPIM